MKFPIITYIIAHLFLLCKHLFCRPIFCAHNHLPLPAATGRSALCQHTPTHGSGLEGVQLFPAAGTAKPPPPRNLSYHWFTPLFCPCAPNVRQVIFTSNIYRLFFTKRTFFEQEREVRLLYSVCDIENHIKGIPLYVNLKKIDTQYSRVTNV